MDPSALEQLHRARRARHDAARPDIVSRVHERGHLTARERITALLDPDSAVEYGGIAARDETGAWIPEAGGVDFIGTIRGQPVVTSSTDYTDHGGGYGAGRLGRLFGLAHEHRWPAVIFVDGGGSRARHPRAGLGHTELSGPRGRFTIIDGMAELSGWAPTVAIVSGPSFAGHASLAGFSDCLIATRGSAIGMGGPPMVEAALGQRLSAVELAGAEMHEGTGGIDLLVDDEHAAIAAARRFLGYHQHPAANSGAAGAANESTRAAAIDTLVPSAGTYDVMPVIEALADDGSVMELRPRFAGALITALARIHGHTVGVIANQPLIDGGAIDENAASKLTRFIELCDAYEYPLLALIDSPGTIAQRTAKATGRGRSLINRWHTRALLAHQHRTVPLFSVQMRRAGGLAGAMMNGFSSAGGQPMFCVAWPTVQTGQRDGLSALIDGNAFDDVIAPSETRDAIGRLLRYLPPAPARSNKKHPIDTC